MNNKFHSQIASVDLARLCQMSNIYTSEINERKLLY